MIERKVDKLGSEVSRASLFVSRSFSSAITVERSLEKKSLDLKRKIVEARGRTLRTIGSRDKDSQTTGGIGGALGLLGLGISRKLFRPRVPKTPGSLLRLQRGATISRAGQLGRVGRLARPLAIVGTGLDFIGRRAEGQTNVQAGVGAAGGLAGSLAGAKYGAILGTAVAGPIGTAVGGVGGAIIGGLAGGRIADLFTGANRRRQFEEERTLIRTQRTLYADALDDFDKVLDKLEGLAPVLVLKRDDDDELPPRDSRPRDPIVPKPKTPFFEKPVVRTIGITLAVAGLVALSVFTRGKTARGSEKAILQLLKNKPASFKKLPLKEQLQVLFKEAKKEELLTRMSKSPFLTKRGSIVPGQKGAPAMSDKGKLIRNLSKEERGLLKIIKDQKKRSLSFKNFLRKSKLESPDLLERNLKKAFDKDYESIMNAYKKIKNPNMLDEIDMLKKIDKLRERYDLELLRIDRYKLELEDLFDKSRLLKKAPKGKEGSKVMEDFLKNLRNVKKKNNFEPNKTFEQDLSSNFESPGGTDIALAPTNNIFLINQSEGDSIEVVSDDTPATMTNMRISPYSAAAKYAEFTASLTA